MLEAADDGTIVILYTGHGMDAKYHAQFFLDDILLRLGYANQPKTEVLDEISTSLNRHRRVDDFPTLGWQRMPLALKRLGGQPRRSLRGWVEDSRPTPAPAIDPAASQRFTVRNNSAHGAIRINLVEREPDGKVRRGLDYDALVERLAADLMEIVNLDSGEPVADRIFRTDSVHRGDHLDDLPDVLIEWNQRHPVFAIGSDKIGRLDGVDPYTRTGDHRKGGMFVALGPGVRQGRLDRAVDVTDFGPTIARLLGVELADVERTPIAEIANPPVGETVPG